MKRIDVNDIVGKKFNRLTVLSFDHKKPHPNPTKGYFYFYKCQCECGNITVVKRERLISLETKSCGCYGKELRHSLLATKRELNYRLYRIWCGMKQRCYNPNNERYIHYGNKGISICSEWLENYDNFYNWAINNGYSEKLSIDRIDNNSNYEPSNCRWTNAKNQATNRTTTNFITYNNQTLSISEWSCKLGINRYTLDSRIERGWSIEKAFNTPVRKINKNH